MHEYTPDQVKFVESFTNKRDSLTLEVGLLTHEKEQLLITNRELAENNTALQKNIDEMTANSSRIGFEEAEKVNQARLEYSTLVEEIETLKAKRELMSKDLDEKNNTLINLGVLIKSIQMVTEDTTSHIRKLGTDLNQYTAKVESASLTVQHEAETIKSLTTELSGVIDSERKANYEKSREIDNREIAVIGREKLVEMKYQEVIKGLNK